MELPHLSRVDVWHLENLLFKLIRCIQEIQDSNYLFEVGEYEMAGNMAWIDRDTKIAEFFEKPHTYEYGPKKEFYLTEETLFALRNFIIENEQLALAIDLTETELNLHALTVALKDLNTIMSGSLNSIRYLEMIRDFRYEIFKWANIHASRIDSSIKKEIKKRKDTMAHVSENIAGSHIKIDLEKDVTVSVDTSSYEEDEFDLSDHFISSYDKAKILKIYKRISVLAIEKGDQYTRKILSILAYAEEQKLLRGSFSKLVDALLGKFHIPVMSYYKRSSNYSQPTIKGIHRPAYQEAIDFFATL